MTRRYIPTGLLLAVTAVPALGQSTLQSDEDKTLYALGVAMGSSLESFQLDAAELEIVAAGLADAVLGNDYQVDMNVYGERIQQLAANRASASASEERQAAAAYLDQMAQEPGAERTASGLIYIPVTIGSGPNAQATDTVRVHYHGTLRDGTVFDSSIDRGEPVSFALNGVIPCWTEGLQRMSVGAKSRLVCPPDIAYGDAGVGPIPGGAALHFEVELLEIE